MLTTNKTDLLNELKRRVEDKILEPTNRETKRASQQNNGQPK